MATAPQIHSTESIDKHDWMLHPAAPRIEAQALFVAMRQNKETVESIRELIEVSTESPNNLKAFVRCYPEEAQWIELSLLFRKLVATEFERLILLRQVHPGQA